MGAAAPAGSASAESAGTMARAGSPTAAARSAWAWLGVTYSRPGRDMQNRASEPTPDDGERIESHPDRPISGAASPWGVDLAVRRASALVARDWDEVDRQLHPAFVYVNANGDLLDRDAYLAFLADGESWSSSALAIALGASPRTVQRALDSLAAAGKVQSFGHARARRWMTPPVPGFTTTLLLPSPLPTD